MISCYDGQAYSCDDYRGKLRLWETHEERTVVDAVFLKWRGVQVYIQKKQDGGGGRGGGGGGSRYINGGSRNLWRRPLATT